MNYLLTALLGVLLSGVEVQAKQVVMDYDDFVTAAATVDYREKLRHQCEAERSIYIKLKGEQGRIVELKDKQLKILLDEIDDRKKLDEIRVQIIEALDTLLASKTEELAVETRHGWYKTGTVIFLLLLLVVK